MSVTVYLRDRRPGALWLCRPPVPLSPYDAQRHYRAYLPAACVDGRVGTTIAMAARRSRQPAGVLDVGDHRALAALPPDAEVTLFGLPAVVIVCPLLSGVLPVELVARLREAGQRVWVELDDDFFTPHEAAYWAVRAAPTARLPPPHEQQADLDRMREGIIHLAGAATGVIASTPVLAAAARRHTRDVQVMRSMVDPALLAYNWPPRPSAQDAVVRIGIAGSLTHNGDDLALAWPALRACAHQPAVEVHLWGAHPRFREGLLPHTSAALPVVLEHERVPYHYHGSLGDFRAYHHALSMLDIAVAPLADTPFNRAKSACKWLENSVHGTPMVLSDLPPYECVEHGVTGLKARTPEDFERYLRLLVEDAERRRRIGEAAREAVGRAHSTAALDARWRAFIESEQALVGGGP